MDATIAPSQDLVSGDYQALLHTFYATIDNQARRRGKPEPSDDLTGLLNPVIEAGGVTFLPQPSFSNQVASSILDAGRRALQDHAEGHSRFVTVSAPTGSSKSSFAWCLVASLVKTYPDISIVFACETMAQCEETYWGIHEAMEIVESLSHDIPKGDTGKMVVLREPFKATKDQLVVWTGGHDRSVPLETIRDRVDNFTPTERTRRFHREDMLSARVVVCTHAKVASSPEQVAYRVAPLNSQRVHWENGGTTRPRTLTIFDEQAHQVKVFETSLPKMVEAEEIVGRFAGNSAAIAVGQLRKDMEAVWSSSVQESRLDNLILPSTFDTHWFQSEQASGLLKGVSDDDVLANVIGFARSLSVGHAFVSKEKGDGNSGVFIGYGLKFKPAPGSLLLDATADIDGIKQIVPESRTAIDVPAVNFANLEVHHIETPKELMKGSKGSTQRVVKNAKTARPYAEWIKATITASTSPGEFALAVVHKTLLDHDYLPKAGIKTEDGRHIAFVNWGIGIGSNAWKDATAVFLFGEHYPRRLPTLAGVLGLTGAGGEKAQEYLASVNGLNTGEVNYRALQLGHLERWEKQMALRGTGRNITPDGVCGHQRLFVTAEFRRFMSCRDRLFGGAAFNVEETAKAVTERTGQGNVATKRFAALLLSFKGDKLSTKEVCEKTGINPAHLRAYLRLPFVSDAYDTKGWHYVPGRGRAHGYFLKGVAYMEWSAADDAKSEARELTQAALTGNF